MQICETGLEKPLIQQVVSHRLDSLLETDSEALLSHLIEALTELADRVWNHLNTLKHLARDSIQYVEQLNEHLPIKSLLTVVFNVAALVGGGCS